MLAPNFAFAHNTVSNASTFVSPYKIVSGQKPKLPLSMKLCLLGDSKRIFNFNILKEIPLLSFQMFFPAPTESSVSILLIMLNINLGGSDNIMIIC